MLNVYKLEGGEKGSSLADLITAVVPTGRDFVTFSLSREKK